ncbi:TIM barrel protein [Microlunatus elymi]|uniref:mannonate dehydratase n=1 Tax=Microlunatus elymi TaxID=2596828 RepID=A0A516PVN8_9ACTN|nr:mannonate dehydratase [Microlunatus elymi]QDP95229.1 TIM barrel protein [Microlunatus elymi]
MKIAEILPGDQPGSPLWHLMLQAGVTDAVGTLPPVSKINTGEGDAPWDYLPLQRLKDAYNRFGFELGVIEWRPPLNRAKRGLPGRDDEIDAVCALLRSMGRLGIPVWCYEWMTDRNWVRTSTSTQARGGSLVTGFDRDVFEAGPPSADPISEDQLWDNLEYFLRRVVPVAEDAGVRLAMHPDDPPVSPLGGIGRIMSSLDGYRRLLQTVPSPMNGITFCQGNFRLMTDDLPAAIRELGADGKIFFIHFRDVEGNTDHFTETWHDAGPTDMYACIKAYRDIGFDGLMRCDHVPNMYGEPTTNVGYGTLGRLYAVGYMRGLIEAATRDRVPQPAAV